MVPKKPRPVAGREHQGFVTRRQYQDIGVRVEGVRDQSIALSETAHDLGHEAKIERGHVFSDCPEVP